MQYIIINTATHQKCNSILRILVLLKKPKEYNKIMLSCMNIHLKVFTWYASSVFHFLIESIMHTDTRNDINMYACKNPVWEAKIVTNVLQWTM